MSCYENVSGFIPARHLLCFMFFLGFMVTFLLRINISLAIIAMVNTTAVEEGNLNVSGGCQTSNVTVSSQREEKPRTQGEFNWNEVEQSIILSSFFWGYLFFQVPGGRIAEVVGAKKVFGGSVLLNGILQLMLPSLARAHWFTLLVIRALQGLSQGVVFPALSAAVTFWVPLPERARFVSFAVQGASLGIVLAMPMCGMIVNQWGWEWVFYISGILALMWCVAWWFLMFDTPNQHPRISREEKQYLKENLAVQDESRPPVPWKSVLTSGQFNLGCLAGIGNDWGYHTFMILGPKYLKGALGFNVSESGWLSSLPFLCQYIFANFFGVLVDILLKQKKLSVRGVRRLSTVISHLLPAASLIVLSLTGCNAALAVAILTIAVMLIGAYSSGFFQNPIDIAPNYAGSLTGLMNGVGSVTGIISTPIAGAVLQNDSTTEGWKVIFWLSAIMYTVCSLPYMIWLTAEVQPWNTSEEKGKPVPTVELSRIESDTEDQTDDELTKTKRG